VMTDGSGADGKPWRELQAARPAAMTRKPTRG
jgi:hypothetical protein